MNLILGENKTVASMPIYKLMKNYEKWHQWQQKYDRVYFDMNKKFFLYNFNLDRVRNS